MPRARYSLHKSCEQCHKSYLAARSNSRFCSDECRVKSHRIKNKPNFEEKYNELIVSMRNAISLFEKRAANAEKSSKEKSRPIGEKLAAGDMAREYQSIANEIRHLLEGSEMTYEQRIAAIYSVDPINYD